MIAGMNSRLVKFVALLLCAVLFPAAAHCSGDGVSASATVVFRIGQFPITDSVVMSWIVSAFIVAGVRFALVGGVKIVPTAGQAAIESVMDGLRSIVEQIVGRRACGVVLPCLVSYFLFILMQNLGGLLPGVGSIGMRAHGEFVPFFRPANADLNTTLALAVVAFFAWIYFSVKCAGVGGLYFEVFGNKADKSELSFYLYSALFVVFFAVGFIECISILCRIISLSFRLFGNTFGGENLLHNMYGFSDALRHVPVINALSYLIPVPFYLLEFLVAIIQSFVFTLLLSVYIGLVCNHGDGGHGGAEKFSKKEEYVECSC
jgi:F-type H+-transporting ATPase subunit a